MWYSKTRWILAAVLIFSVILANPFRPWTPQQRFYRELADRHAKLAVECRERGEQARARGDAAAAVRLLEEAIRHDRQSTLLRRASYESDESKTGGAWRP